MTKSAKKSAKTDFERAGVTVSKLEAVMRKYGWSMDDLDARRARVVFCEAAHGPPPIDAHYSVASTCGNKRCVAPEHLEWRKAEGTKRMKKYSYSKKPLTVAAVAAIEGTKFSYSRRTQVLKRATELCGIVPFDWHKTEIYDGDRLPLPPGKGFVMYFGFDTTLAAEAAKQRLTEANFGALVWDVDHENRCIGEALREAERGGRGGLLH